MSEPNPIRNVSDTALWVAIYRAMESERPDAIFSDPYARRLGGARGEAIVRSLPGGENAAWSIIVRTVVIDEIVLRCIAEGAKTVLNLAAGLDTRPYRMDLPASLRWIHADMPEMVDYYREKMAGETPRCRLEFAAADLREEQARSAVFAKANEEGPVLVITEGLLVYLETDDVASLARDLRRDLDARWWISDLISPEMLSKVERKLAARSGLANAPFRFAPEGGSAFFAPYGWREAEWRSMLVESIRLRRTMRYSGFLRLLAKLMPARKRRQFADMYVVALFTPDP